MMEGENASTKALVSTLLSNFPELAKKNAPLHELSAKGSGCMVLLVPTLMAATYIGGKMLGAV